jgi:hypothetical protein
MESNWKNEKPEMTMLEIEEFFKNELKKFCPVCEHKMEDGLHTPENGYICGLK